MKVFDINQVKSIDWEALDVAPLDGEMANDLLSFINRSVRYITKTWWRESSFHAMAHSNYLTIKLNTERNVLPMANMAKTIAVALKFNIFDQDITRTSYQKAQDKTMKLIRTISYYSVANMANGWRSVAVAAECGMAGMLMWDKLNKADRNLFVNMLDYVASELLDAKAQFRYPMDISTDFKPIAYDSNCAKVLNVACTMMPSHEKAQKWQIKAKYFLKAATSTEKDGMRGFNITDEGLCYVGESLDVDGLLSASNGLDSALINLLYGKVVFKNMLGNIGAIYRAFNNLYLARGRRLWEPLYKRRIDGCLVAELNTAGKAKASSDKGQIVDAYLADCYAHCFSFDEGNEVSSRSWAEARMDKMQIRQKAHATFSYYPNFRASRQKEARVAASAAQAYATLYFKAANALMIIEQQ